MDRGAWQTTVHGVAESDMTQVTEYRDYIDAFFFIFFHYGLSQDIKYISCAIQWDSLIAQLVKNLPAMQEIPI